MTSRSVALPLLLAVVLFAAVVGVVWWNRSPTTAAVETPLEDDSQTPEGRALRHLAVEVPQWYAENRCYSCHNNGDAARALFAAGSKAPRAAIEDTLRWLSAPDRWDDNRGDPRFSDKNLARLQFAHALLGAIDAGLVDATPLVRAAELVAEYQQPDGRWEVDLDGPGSPATYGSALATLTARRILHRADAKKHREAVERADEWLHQLPAKSVGEAAVLLRALVGVESDEATHRRQECLELLAKAQDEDGGWGPFVRSPSEVFDTALVVLSLVEVGGMETKEMVRRGRAYLLATQQEDGSWVETMRVADSNSYAQKTSTSGWATLALLATQDEAN